MDLKSIKKMLRDFKNIGVEVIEFTGGDVSVYLYSNDVLHTALDLNFVHMAILTNGCIKKRNS